MRSSLHTEVIIVVAVQRYSYEGQAVEAAVSSMTALCFFREVMSTFLVA